VSRDQRMSMSNIQFAAGAGAAAGICAAVDQFAL